MSQKGVEGLLGRLITDGEFRKRFYQEPAASCMKEKLEITTRELEALITLEETAVEQFARRLDPKIVRAAISADKAPVASPVRATATATSGRSGPNGYRGSRARR
jgi:hypothetical protein